MNQIKIGLFLKKLRNEKNLTQEQAAEIFSVTNRTISRWENGNNMPDLSLLVEIADFYDVGIQEIIDGERKNEDMNLDEKETLNKVAAYSKNEISMTKQKVIGILLMIFGLFLIVSALSIFPSESSWGSIYSIIGGMSVTVGVYFIIKRILQKRIQRVACVVGCIALLFGIFTLTDYIAVSQFQQVPRFSYEKNYGGHTIEHKTLFYTVIQENPGTEHEIIKIEH